MIDDLSTTNSRTNGLAADIRINGTDFSHEITISYLNPSKLLPVIFSRYIPYWQTIMCK